MKDNSTEVKQFECANCGKVIYSTDPENEVCPHCAWPLERTETDIYADQGSTLAEVIAVVKGKMAEDLPMMTAKEEFVEDVLTDAVDLFGYNFVFGEEN